MQSKRRQKLKQIKYRVVHSCGMCEHGCFLGATDAGVCTMNTIPGRSGEKPLPINRYGTCVHFEKRIPVQLGWWGTSEVPQPVVEPPPTTNGTCETNGAMGKNLSLF